MKFSDPNDSPHGILKNGSPIILGMTGERPGYLWYWDGQEHLTAIKGATFDERTGLLATANGTPHGWISPVTDMEEIPDDNAALGEWTDMKNLREQQHFQEWLANRLAMADRDMSD